MKRFGKIKAFVLPDLGQLDRELPNPPANLVRKEDAHTYPTDFNAMPTEWVDRLSLRGEQLTLCLARAYIPDWITENTSRTVSRNGSRGKA
jgi:NTE family protein